MIIIASKTHNDSISELHWDFLRETSISFDVALYEQNSLKIPPPKSNVIALRHDKGVSIEECDLSQIQVVLIGSDDSGDDKWMEDYRSVKIPTPNQYFLWSGVALGIFLYEHSKLNSNASCSLHLACQDGC